MKINNSYILLKDICCFAYHGVAPQENIIGNEYIINLKLKVDISQAIQTDDVVDTVNYAEIHEAVKAEMSIPSKLLEHVCGRIAKRLLAEFPAIEEIELRLSNGIRLWSRHRLSRSRTALQQISTFALSVCVIIKKHIGLSSYHPDCHIRSTYLQHPIIPLVPSNGHSYAKGVSRL